MPILQGLIIAISTFSGIPTPKVSWEARGMAWALMFLPVVGLCIGAVLVAWYALCSALEVLPLLRAVGYTVLPLLVTGAIHMDGFCDTADALASNAGVQKRQEILHDPHSGAFAIIAVALYLLVFFGFTVQLPDAWSFVLAFAAVFIVSRGLGGLATLWFEAAETSQLASALRNPRVKAPSTAILILWVVAGAALLVICTPWPGMVALIIAVLVFVLARFWLVRQFGGFSGDLAGWLIQMVELTALVGLVLTSLILEVL